MKKLRLIVAGQIPPPVGGQALMIAQTLGYLRSDDRFAVEHLPFNFTRHVGRTRRAGFDKVIELFAVLGRLVRLRSRGAIDGVLYPVGGPQFVPLVRDACLLPFVLLASRKVILHYHAAGVGETIEQQPWVLRRLIRFLYGKVAAAIVMTSFGRKDASVFGIPDIRVVPNVLEDTYDPARVKRGETVPQILYLGHLSQEKGTPWLLEAVANLRQTGVACRLQLVGEFLPNLSQTELESALDRLNLREVVRVSNATSAAEKWEHFARADLFVFPSVAPESFGLVTVEAMMWGLPVVLFDWRGNREVVGEIAGGICVSPRPDPGRALTAALREAFDRRSEWEAWGQRNRTFYQEHYEAKRFSRQLADILHSVMET